MGNGYEEALHQGYSAADMAADMEEMEKRMQDIGCFDCKYRDRNSRTCDVVIRDESGTYQRCPYYKKEVD